PIHGIAACRGASRVVRAADKGEARSSVEGPGDIEARSASGRRGRTIVLHVVTHRVTSHDHSAFHAIKDSTRGYLGVDCDILFQTQTKLGVSIGVLKSDAVCPVGYGTTGLIGIKFECPRSGKVRILGERHAGRGEGRDGDEGSKR